MEQGKILWGKVYYLSLHSHSLRPWELPIDHPHLSSPLQWDNVLSPSSLIMGFMLSFICCWKRNQ